MAMRLHRDMVTIHQDDRKLGGSEALRATGQLAAMAISGAGVFLAAKTLAARRRYRLYASCFGFRLALALDL
ncbi:MAG: hypothetical protein R3C55_12055 [Parvularculaceae bacterium]